MNNPGHEKKSLRDYIYPQSYEKNKRSIKSQFSGRSCNIKTTLKKETRIYQIYVRLLK